MGISGLSAALYKTNISYLVDSINISFICYIGLSNNLSKQITILVQLSFDYSSLDFAILGTSISSKTVVISAEPITKMFIANNFLILQSNSTGNLHLYNCFQ